MPLYEYKCNKCNRQFEIRQKFSDLPVTICPECGGEVKKLISSAAFALKGGGWSSEGYGNEKKNSDPPACPAAAAGDCPGCHSAK
ncbi:MAG: zinc ribbon domain-containing protein [Desulfuromonadales bacterium]|nr:zinc ribbon domain-containing protein [Desulfuromonadales bacterium]